MECTGRAQTNVGDICRNDGWLGQAGRREGSGKGMPHGERESGIDAGEIGEMSRAYKRRLGGVGEGGGAKVGKETGE